MKTTIVMGFNNYVDYLEEAVMSIAVQTVPVQLVIFDWGNTGLPDQMAAKYPNVRVEKLPMRSTPLLCEKIKAIMTPYILMFCADDIMKRYYIELAEDVLDNNPNIDIVVPD